MNDIAESARLADHSKRQSKLLSAKLQQDVSALETAQLGMAPAEATATRRNLIRSVKLSKGWSDDSAEWKAMQAKEVRRPPDPRSGR